MIDVLKVNSIIINSSKDLDESVASHYIILFKGLKNHLFKGLYSYDPVLEQSLKVYGGMTGPDVLDAKDVIAFYKYDSGSRTFKTISTKSFGRTVHAVAVGNDAIRSLRKHNRMQ